MNHTSFLGLVQNAALLLATAFLFDVAASRWRTRQSSFRQALSGLALGAIGITVMLTPWTFGPGIVFDTRSIMLGISGLFFGSVSTAIAMAMTAAFRYYLGGTGAWTGIAVILTSGVIGIAWRHFRRRPLTEISWRELYLFGLVIHLAMLGLMLTLPWATALRVLTNISLPVLVIYPPGTALLGVLMVNRLRRERVEERLRESEEIFRSFMEYSPIYVFFKDENIRAIHLSKNYEKMLGKPVAELLGKNMDDLFPSELAKCMVADDMRILKEGKLVNVEEEFNGRFYSTIKFPIFIDGKQPYLAGYTIDISDRKHAEELYRTVVESSLAAVFIVQDGKLRYTNDTTIIYSGYSSEELIGQRSDILVHPEDREMLRIKIREMLLRKDVSPCEFRVVTKDGRIKWILQIFSPIMHEGKPAILGNAIDITERKQAGEQLKQSLEQLRRAVETTIQVLALAVETRDPYTAGHQQRTTNLARAIATEMGLPTEKIEGIRMAGHIHDIGKISVPAEILSKPTKLTEIELSLIQEHAQHGYDILKDVVSAWPLAEMVYQHHERMDGSGYPRRLKGEEILIEARILAVADVVESMASNRPYRPSLGIDAALEEIEKNSGTLYDNTVADACLRIFREKGFRLEGI